MTDTPEKPTCPPATAGAPAPEDATSAPAASGAAATTDHDASSAPASIGSDAPGDGAAAPATIGGPPDLTPAATAARLADLFPALFGPGAPKPIKLRIQADVQQRAPGVFSRKALSVFLHRHTTSTAYLRALVGAATRFDLDGEPAGEIADEHRDAATAELARRQEIVRARRAAERVAQRQGRGPAPSAPVGPGAAPDAPPAGTERPHRGPADRPGRPPRGDAGPGAGRPPRGPRHGERPERQGRGGRDGRDGGAGRNVGGSLRPPRRDDPVRTAMPAPVGAHADRGATAASGPVDEAQRQRALLLRTWEASPLTKANFCTLKRMTEADFDAQIAQAQTERASRR
jgi:sRNA-binding protein